MFLFEEAAPITLGIMEALHLTLQGRKEHSGIVCMCGVEV